MIRSDSSSTSGRKIAKLSPEVKSDCASSLCPEGIELIRWLWPQFFLFQFVFAARIRKEFFYLHIAGTLSVKRRQIWKVVEINRPFQYCLHVFGC